MPIIRNPQQTQQNRFLFLILIALNAMVSYAYDFEVDGIEYNLLSIENNTVEVANASNVAGSADGTDRVLVIPASININGRDLKVVSIGKEAVRGPRNS